MPRPLAVHLHLLAAALAVGLLAGAVVHGPTAIAGFWLVAFDGLRRTAWTAIGAMAVLLLLAEATRRVLGARLGEGRSTLLGSLLGVAPAVAVAGWRMNRALAIRPSDLAEPWAFGPNLLLVAAGVALAGVVAWALARRRPGSPRRVAWLAAAAVLLVLETSSWAARLLPMGEKSRPDVLVLLLDALRADHLGVYGYRRPTSPTIDAFAREAVVFRQAIAQGTFTKTSVASLFTGLEPHRHGVYWGSYRDPSGTLSSDVLDGGETTLAEALRDHGYLTSAWIQNSQLLAGMGYEQGFLGYHDQAGNVERIHRRLFRWLAGPARRSPFFAYVHYIDLHDPYQPPPPYDSLFEASAREAYAGIDLAEWGAYLEAVRAGEIRPEPERVAAFEALYDGQIRHLDDRLAELFARLRAAGLYDRSLIVLTADHGDGFLEHGFLSHSTTPYEELVRVPLLVKLPHGRFAGRVIDAPVRLVDVFPTVLEAVGATSEVELDGCSLLPLLREEGAREDPRCEIAITEIAAEGRAPTVAVRAGGFKWIHFDGRPGELYDLAADPRETTDLAAERPEVAERLEAIARDVEASRRDRSHARVVLDPARIRDLKTLGYVGGGKRPPPPTP